MRQNYLDILPELLRVVRRVLYYCQYIINMVIPISFQFFVALILQLAQQGITYIYLVSEDAVTSCAIEHY